LPFEGVVLQFGVTVSLVGVLLVTVPVTVLFFDTVTVTVAPTHWFVAQDFELSVIVLAVSAETVPASPESEAVGPPESESTAPPESLSVVFPVDASVLLKYPAPPATLTGPVAMYTPAVIQTAPGATVILE
jgi:hypothetical protein